MKGIVAIIGPNESVCEDEQREMAKLLGAELVENGYAIVCGGKGGVMAAVCEGAHSAKNYFPGATIGIMPENDDSEANPWVDIAIPTGIGKARNQIVVNTGQVVIAIGGGSGTLSELAFAWSAKKPIVAFSNLGGWAGKMAGKSIDSRRKDTIQAISSVEEALDFVRKNLR